MNPIRSTLLQKNRFVSWFGLFILFWGGLNILQALTTSLIGDEAYYWMYAQHLDWGYFDHPPMIALFIKVGYFLLHNALGVRLLTIGSMLGIFLILWKLINYPQKDRYIIIFLLLILSIPVFHVYGFIATPDSPLFLFTGIFLITYRAFLKSASVKTAILLGIAMAGLLYSKYHGILVILFTIMAHISLLRSKHFYTACIIAFLLFIPHLLWQWEHEFPSVSYHLIERASSSYKVTYTVSYLINQLVIFNPFLLGFFLIHIKKLRISSIFDRTLYMIFWGFILFFFLASFRGHVEPHWTGAAVIPYSILLFRIIINQIQARKYFFASVTISLVLIITLRLIMAVNIFQFIENPVIENHPMARRLQRRFYNSEHWANRINSISKGHPVVFENSYQSASKLNFYSSQFATSYNSIHYRKNQYDIWDFNRKIHGKTVFFVSSQIPDARQYRIDKNTKLSGVFIPAFINYTKVDISLPDTSIDTKIHASEMIPIQLVNPYTYPLYFKDGEKQINLLGMWNHQRSIVQIQELQISPQLTYLSPQDTVHRTLQFTVPDTTGTFRFGVLLQNAPLPPRRHSNLIPVQINSELKN